MSDTDSTDVKSVAIDPRHTSRVLALQQLFNHYAQTNPQPTQLTFSVDELKEIYEQDSFNEQLYQDIYDGVIVHQEKIDQVIQKLAPLWPIAQISLIDLVILRLSIWEAFVAKRVPEKVGIDEAIELAKEFAGEASAKFVNGVLGNLLKNTELQDLLHT